MCSARRPVDAKGALLIFALFFVLMRHNPMFHIQASADHAGSVSAHDASLFMSSPGRNYAVRYAKHTGLDAFESSKRYGSACKFLEGLRPGPECWSVKHTSMGPLARVPFDGIVEPTKICKRHRARARRKFLATLLPVGCTPPTTCWNSSSTD